MSNATMMSDPQQHDHEEDEELIEVEPNSGGNGIDKRFADVEEGRYEKNSKPNRNARWRAEEYEGKTYSQDKPILERLRAGVTLAPHKVCGIFPVFILDTKTCGFFVVTFVLGVVVITTPSQYLFNLTLEFANIFVQVFEYISIWYLVFSFYNVFNSMFKMFGLIFMHFLIAMALYCYYKAITTSPGYVPFDWVCNLNTTHSAHPCPLFI